MANMHNCSLSTEGKTLMFTTIMLKFRDVQCNILLKEKHTAASLYPLTRLRVRFAATQSAISVMNYNKPKHLQLSKILALE